METKDISGHEGLYKITDTGEIISVNFNHTGKEKVMKPATDTEGYQFIKLFLNGKVTSHKVHRLVAQAFIPNPDNKEQVNHLDSKPANNCVENLEWVTPKENIRHGIEHGNIDIKRTYLRKPVNQLDLQGNFIRKFDCLMDAERELGIHNSSISKCAKGDRNTAGKFRWGLAKNRILNETGTLDF